MIIRETSFRSELSPLAKQLSFILAWQRTVPISFPPPGEEASFLLDEDTRFVVRHGSSLSITANVCTFLVNSDTFSHIDPNTDHHKWARKRLGLYYACVVDESA